jgi:hypothetical protein
MDEQSSTENSADQLSYGLTRREALKKGALLGGALIWTTPAVQAIGILPAHAQEVSPLCEVRVSFGPPGSPIEICFRTTPDVCACIADCGPNPTGACVAECLVGAELEPC